jgi:hypothetical protein
MKMYERISDEIEGLKKISRNYELILVDTCALYSSETILNTLKTSTIENSRRFPVICDFIEHEFRSLDGRYSKKFLRTVRHSPKHSAKLLETNFKTKRESMESLNVLPSDVKNLVIKVYQSCKGLEEESRHRDFALISEAFLLAQAGINCGILSLDKCIEKAIYELSNMGHRIKFYRSVENRALGKKGTEMVKGPERLSVEPQKIGMGERTLEPEVMFA